MNMNPEYFQKLRTGFGYPDVPPLFGTSWDDTSEGYEAVEYVASSVKENVPDWENPDLDMLWERAQTLSVMGDLLIRDSLTGRPLNPGGPTGISGFGRLRSYGPSLSADGIVIHQNHVLLIDRSDTGQTAFPGGYREIDPLTGECEDPVIAALREVGEETSLDLDGGAELIAQGVPYFVTRNTDNAWVEDSAVLIDVSDTPRENLLPVAGDDAKPGSARWVPLTETSALKMSPRHAEHVRTLMSRC